MARQLGVAPSTVGLHVDQLIRASVLKEAVSVDGSRGRPPTLLELNPAAGQFVGVDFDARAMFATSVDFAQQPLESHRDMIRHDDSADNVLRRMAAIVARVADPARPILGIGAAVPGVVDAARGIGLNYRFIRGWRDVPVVSALSDRFDVPVELENNIRAMALAERLFDQGRETENFVCIGVRSGIGSGLVIDGRLYRGPDGKAGELGSWPCRAADGREMRTLEEVASLRAILNDLTAAVRAGERTSLVLHRKRVTVESLLDAVRSADRLTLRVLKRAATSLGRAVAQISVLLNPRRIVIAGPLADAGDAWLGPLSETVEELLSPAYASMPLVELSTLGANAGAMGAAALAVNRWKFLPVE